MRRPELTSDDVASLVMERESPDELWWQVTLDARGPSGSTRVDPGGELYKTPVATFFADQASEWRG